MNQPFVLLDSVDKVIVSLCFLSIVIEVFNFVNATVMVAIFSKMSTMHINMRINCCNLWVCMIMRAVLRLSINIFYLFGYNVPYNTHNFLYLFTMFHGTCNCAIAFLQVSIIVERILSALSEKMYENYFSLPLLVTMLIFPWVFSVLSVFAVFIFMIIDMMVYNYATLAMLVFTWTALFSVLNYVKHVNIRSKRNKSLSERYQHYENIKTKRTLYWFSVASAFVIFTSFLCQGAKSLYFMLHDQHREYMMAFFNIVLNIAFGASVGAMPFTFIFTHNEIYKKYVYGFLHCHNPTSSATISPMDPTKVPPDHQIISIISGRPLVFLNEGRHYFSALDKEWETAFDTRFSLDFPHKYSSCRRPSTQSERFLSI